jgi:hypothetical protein
MVGMGQRIRMQEDVSEMDGWELESDGRETLRRDHRFGNRLGKRQSLSVKISYVTISRAPITLIFSALRVPAACLYFAWSSRVPAHS